MSVLVDTSIWVDHLRRRDADLVSLLENGQVLVHPWVVGELALGGSTCRRDMRDLLLALPRPAAASDAEVLRLIDARQLHGRGIGYVDAHLLAATVLTAGAVLRSRDRRLATVASDLGLAHHP